MLESILASDSGRLALQCYLGWLVISAVAVAICSMNRRAPAMKIWACTLALGASLMLPLFAFLASKTGSSLLRIDLPAAKIPRGFESRFVDSNSVFFTVEPQILTSESGNRESIDWPSSILVTYCVGVALCLLSFGLGAIRIRTMRFESQPISETFFKRLWRIDSGNAQVFDSIRTLPNEGVPMVVGIRKHTLLLPETCSSALSDEELSQVLAHEAEHVRSGHLGLGVLLRLANSILWPNPLVLVLARIVASSQEELCDAAALSGKEPTQYARLLVKFAELVPGQSIHGLASGMLNSRFPLEHRIRGLIDPHRRIEPTMNNLTRWTAGTVALGALLTLAGTQFGNAQTAEPPVPPPPPVSQSAPAVAPAPPPPIVQEPGVRTPRPAKRAPKAERKAARRANRIRKVSGTAVAPATPIAPGSTVDVPMLSKIPVIGYSFRAPRGTAAPAVSQGAQAGDPVAAPVEVSQSVATPTPRIAPAGAPVAASAPGGRTKNAPTAIVAGRSAPAQAIQPRDGAIGLPVSGTLRPGVARTVSTPTARKAISVIKNATVIVWSDGTTEIRVSPSASSAKKSTRAKTTRTKSSR